MNIKEKERIVKKLQTIRNETDKIIKKIINDKDIKNLGAINYVHVGCSEVRYILNDDFEISIEVVVSNADPSCYIFREKIVDELFEIGFNVDVRTEW